jgi:hypothetical protein
MKLITQPIERQLLANYITSAVDPEVTIDHKPVLKLFTPFGGATWLITEMDPDGDTMFGLCDLGVGYPELGYVSLAEITGSGHRIERDRFFTPTKTLSEYAS